MNVVRRMWAILVVAAKRAISQRWLTLAAALGLVTAIGLTLSIPLYADGVYYRVMREQISQEAALGASLGLREYPPFAFMFRCIGSSANPFQWEDVRPADAYLSGAGASALGLPNDLTVRHFRTDNLRLLPAADTTYVYDERREPLAWVSLGFTSGLQDHVTILEGAFPADDPDRDAPVGVLVSEELALKLGLQVGETYTTFARYTLEGREVSAEIPVRITGVWRPTRPEEAFWFSDPAAFKQVLFVPERAFVESVSPALENEVYVAVWYLVMDGSGVRADDVDGLLGRIVKVRQRASSLLPYIGLDLSPVSALQEYRRAARLLTIRLYAFSFPIIGLILVFITLVAGLSVDRRRGEIAILRSRGASVGQVLGVAAIEGVLLGAIALAVGLPVGKGIAGVLGRTRNFLDFAARSDLNLRATETTIRLGVVAVGIALVAQVAPAVSAARHTVVTYRQERARRLRPPWWQRAWIDVLLLIPAAYGLYLLRQQGGIFLPAANDADLQDPFQNPLLFLVPALSALALSLLATRLLPQVIAVIAWIATRTKAVGLPLAARYLSRTPGVYTAPLVLLVLTLSLSTFVASLAQTLDDHVHDRTYYQVGADMRLIESGEAVSTGALGDAVDSVQPPADADGPRWYFLPVDEHVQIAGVQAAARVGRYRAFATMSGGWRKGTFLGIDRADFPHVAFWRHDFSPTNLIALTNRLAVTRNGVLVPRSFMARHALDVGDAFRLAVDTYGQRTEMDLEIVGHFDFFPTWYPDEENVLFVGNLEHLFEAAGSRLPYEVWLETAPGADYDQIVADVRAKQVVVQMWRAAEPRLSSERQRPDRQGILGLLSVGFMAAAILTIIGFLLYVLFSFRRRFIEMGILRAIGLSAGQMAGFLAWELAFLALTGLGAGTGFGVGISELFIPYLQVGSDLAAQTPPFAPQVAWPAVLRVYALFGLMFALALGMLTALLLRLRIFQAVKLGETT